MSKKILFLYLSIFYFALLQAQNSENLKSEYEHPRGDFRFMFYNVENLFDTKDDSLIRDDDFTPDGPKHWSNKKYYKKINNISKVITAVGQWSPPDVIGICEIENRFVLEGIVNHTPLKKQKYQIIHKDSPDRRGIDVGLLYIKNKFQPIEIQFIRIVFPFDANKPTRDILYVKGKTNKNDTLHIFVNHWPSRWGGQMETDRKRKYVASVVRAKADSLFLADINPKIIIMGDLNDYPENASLIEVLKTKTSDYENANTLELYNLAFYLQNTKRQGSHKYKGVWGVLDQIIVSGALLNDKYGLHTSPDDNHVFNAPFLLEPDETYTGKQPFRTYIGYKFHDGYSDHLPVYLDLWE